MKRALAGALAAAVALGLTELGSGIGNRGPSVIEAVGGRFVDRFAGALKDLAVSLFGTHDKAALITGIVVVGVLVGARLGTAERKWAYGGFAAFGLIGIWAGFVDPLASRPRIVFGSLLGVAGGIVTLHALGGVRRISAAGRNSTHTSANDDPTVTVPTRRAFLAGSVAVAAAVAGRALRDTSTTVVRKVLPTAKRVVAVPPTQPFSVDGLTPYVTPNDDFYRIDTALFVPRVNAATWKLDVTGMVRRPFSLTYDELLTMEMVELPITIQCVSNEVGGELVGTASWRGVPLRDLLARAEVKPGATQIVGRSVDRFTVGFPTAAALDGRDALVAVAMNGEPLPQQHGYPARLIVAGLYGYVSATKWLREIELTRLEDFDAYWVPRGWAKQAPIKTQSRIDVPHGDVAAGPVTIAGVAWAPTRGISRVEVRVDGGAWMPAELGAVASADTWVQWKLDWQAPRGEHVLEVRATDGDGVAQTAKVAPPAPDGATGLHSRAISVR